VALSQESPRAPASVRELSVAGDNGGIAIDISGTVRERILFSPSEARRLIAEIERALNHGFGRDMDAIRLTAARKDHGT
jgi:hypothetical protein